MRGLLSIALMAVTLAATPASAGFYGAAWGMTPEQVAAALPAEAALKPGAKGTGPNGTTMGNAGEHREGDQRFAATYYYDSRGLAMVQLHARPSDCNGIYNDLVGAYGKPYRVGDQAILKLFIWHDGGANNRIRLVASSPICDLYYERLDDYRAVDEAQAAKGR